MDKVDIFENLLLDNYPGVLEILLIDRTTGKNIIWATDNYSKLGKGYKDTDRIEIKLITGTMGKTIRPRVNKNADDQKKRVKEMAEVFTPSWVCNKQINLIDDIWFGYKGSFNEENNNEWVRSAKVKFTKENWKEYVVLIRIEITCGEGPYLASRYDVVNGSLIDPLNRIGVIDRKLRVISENVSEEEMWFEYAKKAFKSTYGYDFQGDNVLLVRENILLTFIDFYKVKFHKNPNIEQINEIADIISWNIWQMDGIKFVIPLSCNNEKVVQFNLFNEVNSEANECKGCLNNNIYNHDGKYSKIKDWQNEKIIKFIDLVR